MRHTPGRPVTLAKVLKDESTGKKWSTLLFDRAGQICGRITNYHTGQTYDLNPVQTAAGEIVIPRGNAQRGGPYTALDQHRASGEAQEGDN